MFYSTPESVTREIRYQIASMLQKFTVIYQFPGPSFLSLCTLETKHANATYFLSRFPSIAVSLRAILIFTLLLLYIHNGLKLDLKNNCTPFYSNFILQSNIDD